MCAGGCVKRCEIECLRVDSGQGVPCVLGRRREFLSLIEWRRIFCRGRECMLSWTGSEIWTRRQGILESGSMTFGAVFARPAPQQWINCSQVRERRSLPLHMATVGVHIGLQ